MRTAPIVAALSALALFVACGGEESTSPPTCVAPDQEITTYYWEDGEWVRHAAWDASFLRSDVKIWLDVANWIVGYSAFWAKIDNIYAYGDLYLNEGRVDDFNDGVIAPIWEGSGANCVMGRGAEACEAAGVLTVVIEEGPDEVSGEFRLAGLTSEGFVAHGEFDVQVDFTLNPEFHETTETRVMLTMIDANRRFAELSVRNGRYDSREVGPSYNYGKRSTPTDHLVGKLRITRTTCPSP
jgi:hypothetical protein